jgi:PH/SEC7 domain-containing protein
MDAFTPPTPHYPLPLPPLPVPDERRGAPMLSPIADVFSNTTTPTTPTNTRHGTGSRKPLPPGPVLQHTEETEDLPTVVVKKPRALPKIPVSPSVTTRRSLSVRDSDDKVTASPAPAVADAVAGDHKPKENAAGWEDNSLHGLLDVFKGELSTLDPVSPASFDLRDPSTPARKLSYQSQANDLVLSDHETQGGGVGGERDEGVRSPPISMPATASRSVEQEDKSALAAIIPPRSSSLQSPVHSIGSGSHATSSRQASYQLTPLRLRTGPAAVTPGKYLRAVHRSSASSSEPSLIPTSDEGRVCEQHSFFHTSFAELKPK